jgi:hypothetical protein
MVKIINTRIKQKETNPQNAWQSGETSSTVLRNRQSTRLRIRRSKFRRAIVTLPG